MFKRKFLYPIEVNQHILYAPGTMLDTEDPELNNGYVSCPQGADIQGAEDR